MDVAYRLYPETDVAGMVGDVKRAIVWLRQNAERFQIDPKRIVVGGGSAGGHLALLAAYAPDHTDLTPDDVRGTDLSVCGVASFYGPVDLAACYYHTHQDRLPPQPAPTLDLATSAPLPAWLAPRVTKTYQRLGLSRAPVAGRLDWLVGGTPQTTPERYALLSPLHHVHRWCPPTLLIQGEDDLVTPVAATRALQRHLRAAGVPVVCVVLPHTDHGFDLVLPAISPSAQSAWYDLDRFLVNLCHA
jgi:acetyl esterase/lipase